jgi:hypothetical protein
MNTYMNPYRIAAVLLVIFCSSHTIGGLLTPQDYGPAANAVLVSMQSVHFDFFGSDCTFDGIRMGLGLMVSVFLVVSAFIAWHLGSPRVRANPAVVREMRPIALSLVLAYVATTALSWRYFFVVPVTLSAAITGLLGWGLLGS